VSAYRCGWCPPDGQCFPCERAEFWDGLTRECAPAFWDAFDEVINPDYRPPSVTDLSKPSNPIVDLLARRDAIG